MTARSEILTEAPPAESAERVAAERSLRERAAVYLELTKPRLSAMAVASAGAGYVLAGGGDPATMASLLAGAGCMAGASAVLNQVLERDLDLQMVRTRARPIPRGAIRPEEALTFGVLLGIAGSTLLAQAVHPASALVGLATLLGYVLVYTPLKRITSLNTFVGAVVGALPALLGVVAVDGGLGAIGAPLFLVVFFWQLPHFWAISWVHRKDYRAAGFAMLGAEDPQGVLTSLSVLATTLLLIPVTLAPAALRLVGPAYFLGALCMGLALLVVAARFALRPDDDRARSMFRASVYYLPALLALMLFDKVGT